jgi:2-keto-4-pentenoate hydratase/2-oxohepta-3-ene-1,7-dioic acid hydratase in catechol pathway
MAESRRWYELKSAAQIMRTTAVGAKRPEERRMAFASRASINSWLESVCGFQFADTFCPIGPWLVTKDEVADPQRLRLWCDVGEVRRQDSNTADMIFMVEECVSYISEFMTLLPGDVITTGTPQGVGLGLEPPQYLRAGDIVRLGIEGLGEQLQNIKPHRAR